MEMGGFFYREIDMKCARSVHFTLLRSFNLKAVLPIKERNCLRKKVLQNFFFVIH